MSYILSNSRRIFGKLLTFSLIILAIACDNEIDPIFRDHMRDFVTDLGNYGRQTDSTFIVIPQNGHELVSVGGEANDDPHMDYLYAIDGAGQEDLLYGYSKDNVTTDEEDRSYLNKYLQMCEANGVEVLVTDYCTDSEYVSASYSGNKENGYISFAAPDRDLNVIPDENPYGEHDGDVENLSDAMNFLYLIDPGNFSNKNEFLSALAATNYDVLILDFFFDEEALQDSDIEQLRMKANGGKRLLISYMSIGEAEDYRYYWKDDWEVGDPAWLDKENRQWRGNYKVKYWDTAWQSIIYGNEDAYLDKIIGAGFDGVYLDIIEAFEYFE